MLIKKVKGSKDLYLIDTQFLNHDRHVGCYIIVGEEVAIIDNGASTGVSRILEALDEIDVETSQVKYLIPTHVHLDHAGGTGYLAEVCENARVVCHSRAKPFLVDSEKVEKLVSSAHRALGDLASEYGDMKPVPDQRVRVVEDGDTLGINQHSLTAIEATGHAPHQMSWYDDVNDGFFVGDEMGMWMKNQFLPATPPPNFDPERVFRSIDRFKERNPDKLYFAHFGLHDDPKNAFSQYKSVLREWIKEVSDAWEQFEDEGKVKREMSDRDSLYYKIWDQKSARQTIETDTTGVLLFLKNKNNN